jgi:hypothetical protein
MSTPSSRRPSKPKTEKRDLSKFANGEESYDVNQGANDPEKQLATIKAMNEFLQTFGQINLNAFNAGAKAVKPENKPPLPQWIMKVTVGVLFTCLMFGIVVAVNYGNYFSKENQNTALTFVFQFPAIIVSFIVGRKTKGD